MDVDVNDVKIIVSTSLQYLMKTCNQYAKDHPLVSSLLLFLLLLYTFLPSLFNIFFHTCPFVICTTIFLGGICSRYPNIVNIFVFRPDQGNSSSNSSTQNHHHRFPLFNHGTIHLSRPSIISSMSRRTFRKGRYTDGERDTKDEAVTAADDESVLRKLMTDDDESEEENHMKSAVDDESVLRKLMTDDDESEEEDHMKFLEEERVVGCNRSNAKGLAPDAGDAVMQSEQGDDNKELPRSYDLPNKTCNENMSSSGDFAKLDAESSNIDAPQEGSRWLKLRCLLDWPEDDQKNLMDLGGSDTERNKRLESLIARRKSRQKLKYYLEQNRVSAIMVGRVTDRLDGQQPGSAPSVLIPGANGNPFDLPYEPSEEKPILSGGSFDEEFYLPITKDILYYKHDSFNYGSWLMGDTIEDDATAVEPSSSSYLTSPKNLDVSRPSMFRKRSDDAEGDFQQIPDKHCQEGKPSHVESDVDVCPIPLPPKANDQKISGEAVTQKDKEPTTNIENTGEKKVNFEEDNPEEEGTDKKITEHDDSIPEKPILTAQDKPKTDLKSTDDENDESSSCILTAQDKPRTDLKSTDDENDESSSCSSDVSVTEDVVSTVKNEAFRNSVRKALTILGPRKSQTALDDTSSQDTEGQQSYTNKLVCSNASNSHVDLSDTESPRYDDDAESLVYDADVDKDAYSGDDDFSPHPVQLEPCGIKSRLHEPRELFKSPSQMKFGYSLPPSKLGEQRVSNRESEGEENIIRAMHIDHGEITDESQEFGVGAEGDVSSVSSSCEWLDHRKDARPRFVMGNLENSRVSGVDSTRAYESTSSCPSESNVEEPRKMNKRATTRAEALNLIDQNLLQMAEYISQTPTSAAADRRVSFEDTYSSRLAENIVHSTSPKLDSATEQVSADSGTFAKDNISGVASTSTEPNIDPISDHQYLTSSEIEVERSTSRGEEDSQTHRSDQNLVSPTLGLNPVTERETTRLSDASLSPTSVLHESDSLDDFASMIRDEDNVNTDNHDPSVQEVVTGESSSSNILHDQPSFSQDIIDMQQPRLSPLETTHHQIAEPSDLASDQEPSVVDSVSSPKSVLRMVASVDEIESMTGEPNSTLMEEAHQNDRSVLMENDNPSQDGQQPIDHLDDGDSLRPIQSSSTSNALGTQKEPDPDSIDDHLSHHPRTQYEEELQQWYLETSHSNQSELNGATHADHRALEDELKNEQISNPRDPQSLNSVPGNESIGEGENQEEVSIASGTVRGANNTNSDGVEESRVLNPPVASAKEINELTTINEQDTSQGNDPAHDLSSYNKEESPDGKDAKADEVNYSDMRDDGPDHFFERRPEDMEQKSEGAYQQLTPQINLKESSE